MKTKEKASLKRVLPDAAERYVADEIRMRAKTQKQTAKLEAALRNRGGT
jgi:hypothetical protein